MQRAILFIFIAFLSFAGNAQDANNLAVDATVKDQEGGRIVDATVSLIQDGSLVNKVSTGRTGRFDLYLDFGHEYIIEISKAGFVSKRLYFNTHKVPEDEQIWGYEFGGFIVDLFKELPGVDYSVLEKPIGKVYYDPNIQNFEYDRTYTKLIKSELDRLLAEYEEKLRQEEMQKQQLEADFQLAMRDAENAINDNDFLTAKENLLAASALKPNDPTPKQKLAEVEQKMNSAGQKEERYLSLLASADQLFGQEKYTEAKAAYLEASGIKPAETYPKDRIRECDAGIAKLAAQQAEENKLAEIDRKYKEEIAKADKEFMAGNYLSAKGFYQAAAGIKAQETYPGEQLKLIEQKLVEVAQAEAQKKANAEVDARYLAQIDKADAAFNSKNYENAKTFYTAALDIKPSEEYPRTQLAVIDERLADMKAQQVAAEEEKRLTAAYKENIAQGDKLFAAASYTEARARYQSASELKPAEQYPKERLAAIDAKLAELEKQNQLEADKKALDERYNAMIAEGDKALKASNYALAWEQFTGAKGLKPAEKYPQQQLDLIATLEATAQREAAEQQRLEAEKAEQDKRYTEALEAGNGALAEKNYVLAKEKYTMASTIKPKEQYPRDQLAEVNRLIAAAEVEKRDAAEQAKVDAAYRERIAEADQLFSTEQYEQARASYNLAAGIKPAEDYPAQQLARIESILKERQLASERAAEEQRLREEQAKTEAAYAQLITTADGYMSTEDYDNARKKYEEAAALKPSESYPKTQLEKIKQRFDELAARQAEEGQRRTQYNQHVHEGDQAILDKQWDKAREAYRAALALYSEEPFPKARLGEIDELERKDREEQARNAYEALIAEADQAFLKKDYESALVSYERALQAVPNDPHASTRIGKINELLAGQNTTETAAEEIAEKKITEETFEEGRSKITIRKVTFGDKVDVYKRVEHSWGGKYYFLNDRPISELVWTRETSN